MAAEAKTPSLAEEYSLPPQEVPVEKVAEEKPSSGTETEAAPSTNDETPSVEDKNETSEVQDAAEKSEAEETNTAAEEASETAEEEEAEKPEIKIETAPADFRFPTTNQTRHCFTRYVEYHRCVAAKGEDAPECDKFAKYYRSLCPGEWEQINKTSHFSGSGSIARPPYLKNPPPPSLPLPLRCRICCRPGEMAAPLFLSAEDMLRVNGSRRFAAAIAAASPFASLADALLAARRIWLNEVDVNGWLEAFAAHPAIGTTSPSVSKWSKEEQSAALSTATDSTARDLAEWNARYRVKFGFVFMICASGRTASEVLAELKRRYTNRPIVELEVAAQEELKITELRLAKLFSLEPTVPSIRTEGPTIQSDKAADRIRIIGAHLGALPQPCANKAPEITGSSNRSRPPITTHVLDIARGSPASGIEVHLEMWKDSSAPPSFNNKDFSGWATLGYSVTNNDGRSGQLMDIVDNIAPGFYRISFNTGKYTPAGFFPYVSIIFEIKENQTAEHFHVPLLHSPFSFTTYRGS